MPPRVRHLKSVCEKIKASKDLKSVIEKASDKEVIALIEFIYNIIRSNVPLYKREFERLSKHRERLEKLAGIRHLRLARNEIVQSGGSIIPLILSAALALTRLL